MYVYIATWPNVNPLVHTHLTVAHNPVRGRDRVLRHRAVRYVQWLTLPVHGVIVLNAVFPSTWRLPAGFAPIQLEAITLSILIFLGMLSATVLLVEYKLT